MYGTRWSAAAGMCRPATPGPNSMEKHRRKKALAGSGAVMKASGACSGRALPPTLLHSGSRVHLPGVGCKHVTAAPVARPSRKPRVWEGVRRGARTMRMLQNEHGKRMFLTRTAGGASFLRRVLRACRHVARRPNLMLPALPGLERHAQLCMGVELIYHVVQEPCIVLEKGFRVGA